MKNKKKATTFDSMQHSTINEFDNQENADPK